MDNKIFSINFYISEEEGLTAKVNTESGIVGAFKEAFGVDLIKVFESEEFNNTVDTVADLIRKEIND